MAGKSASAFRGVVTIECEASILSWSNVSVCVSSEDVPLSARTEGESLNAICVVLGYAHPVSKDVNV